MKLLQFGAGNIGRSFIGQLFSAAGYEVVFADVDARLIEALNEHRGYTVAVRDAENRDIPVKGVRAIRSDNVAAVCREMTDADVCGTSVGPRVLPLLFPALAKAIEARHRAGRGPVDVILCENLRDAARIVRDGLRPLLPNGFPLDRYVGLSETSIGKMVPLMTEAQKKTDPLTVFAEAYNTLILDRRALINPVPAVPGLSPKDNMKAWVDRKSFVHNLGHASLAYFSFLARPEFARTYEAAENPELRAWTRRTMLESCAWLASTYPSEFSMADLTAHTDDLLNRFGNRNLGDTLHRVGRDLARKLSSQDRVTGALSACMDSGLPHRMILNTLAAGLYFLPPDEDGRVFPQDEVIVRRASAEGPETVLREITGLSGEAIALAGMVYKQIQGKGGLRHVIGN